MTSVDESSRTPEEIIDQLQHGAPLGLGDPYSIYAELREQAPIYRTADGLWVLSSYETVSKALRHRGMSTMTPVLRNPRYEASITLQTMANSMLFFDNPADHGRQRRLVSQAFNQSTVDELGPWLERLVTTLLDRCLSSQSFDFMRDFADRIPVATICHMLGVPDEDIDTFNEWNFLITSATGVHHSDEHFRDVDEATTKLLAYLEALLEERSKQPREDLLSRLIVARDEDDVLSTHETLGLAFLLLVAGSDTTAAFLGGAMLGLLRAPDQLQLLRQQRDLMPNALEELMRFEAPVHFGLIRTTTDTLVLDHVEIPVDQDIWTLFSSGNRDPKRFADPNRIDLTRADTKHLGFGLGMHICLGAILARMESRIALDALLDRTTQLTLEQDEIPWIDHGNLRTVANLAVGATAS